MRSTTCRVSWRTPRDPRRQGLDHGAAHHHSLALPALVAGALIAFLQAMTLFGSPGDPGAAGRLPHHDRPRSGACSSIRRSWSSRRRRRAAAAADHRPAAGAKFILGRRGYSVLGGKYGPPRRVEMKVWRWAALAFCLVVLLNPVFLPYFALFNAAFSPNATTLVTPGTSRCTTSCSCSLNCRRPSLR
jgi:iron(III) transport system permease protein